MGKTRLRNPTAFAYGVGYSRRGASSITNLYNFINSRDGGLGAQGFWNIVDPALRPRPGPPTPDYNPLAVGLLDFAYQPDINIKNSLQWYFDKYPFLYPPFRLVDTGYSTPNTLDLLTSYYNKGARYFVLTSHSITVKDCTQWFEEHGDAEGFIPYAQSDILDFPKKMYNLAPLVYQKMDIYSYACVAPYDNIYFLYAPSEPYSVSVYHDLQIICNNLGKTLIALGTLNSPGDFTPENVNAMMQQIPSGQNASIIVAYATYTSIFYNSFYSTTYNPGYNFYETAVFPIFTNLESASYFNNMLYTTSTAQSNLSASYLWQIGFQSFTTSTYGSTVLNTLDLIYGTITQAIVNNLPAQNDTISFDPVKKTCKGASFPVIQFTYNSTTQEQLYTPISIYYKNELGIVFESDISDYSYTPVPQQSILPPAGPNKTAAALLSLTGIESTDTNDLKTLYYLWATTTDFIQMPIYDTQGSIDNTVSLLQQSYDNGVRLFYGFNTSSTLAGVLNWFLEHPDAIGISPSSSANSLAIQKNVYRLQIVDSYILESISGPLNNAIANNGRIFYMYSEGQLASLEFLSILQSTYGSQNILPYAALTDSSNLTQSDLTNFFITQNNVTSNDVIIDFLFIGNQEQTYLNQFNQSLIVPASQYDISQVGFPVINPDTTSLTGLYNVLALENITTSELWDKTALGVRPEFFASNALNALYMITQFSKNQSVYTLGSYNGALQFNEFNDIKYGSVANYLYTENGYTISYIYCTDPLYGQLTFNKIN